MDEVKKILIIDDEKLITDVVKSYFEANNYIAFAENSGRKGIETFGRVNPDLVILDLMLPDLSGEEICKAIRRSSRVPIIMLTAKVEEEDILSGLDIGADDYITKPFSVRQLVARVKTILRRAENDPQTLFNTIAYNNRDLEVDTAIDEVKKCGELAKLTPNEYKILLALIKYPNKTFTREELIDIALGQEYEGYNRTIDTHIKNLRQKIESDIKNPVYILTVRGFGYKFGGYKNEL